MKFIRTCTTVVALLVALPSWTHAQSYPTQAIKLVVPFPPGGSSDSIGRIVANGLAQKFNVPVIVDNRPGAGTMIGHQYVADSAPDGYTLLLAAPPLAINETLYATPPHRVFRDIVPISVVATIPLVMIVHPSSPANTIADLVRMAKERPGVLTYGSSGNGGSPHLSMEMFQGATGTQLVHVPYKGSAPAVLDLVAGHTDVVIDTVLTTLPQATAGKARALAQLGAQRSRLMPDVPTMQEVGVAGLDVSSWFMLAAPAGVAPAILDQLNAAVSELIAPEAMQTVLAKQGFEIVGGDRAAAEAFLRQQVEGFGAAVKRAKLTVE